MTSVQEQSRRASRGRDTGRCADAEPMPRSTRPASRDWLVHALRVSVPHDDEGRPLATVGQLSAWAEPAGWAHPCDRCPGPCVGVLPADLPLADAAARLLAVDAHVDAAPGCVALRDADGGEWCLTAAAFFERLATAFARDALTDGLTGLPNRRALRHELGRRLATAGPATPVVLLSLDLDRFKDVNDSLGHDTGDAVLAEVGRRLRTGLRQEDVVARVAGDEFAVILGPGSSDGDAASDADAEEAAATAARRIVAALDVPCCSGDLDVPLSASVGTVVLRERLSVDEAWRRADGATVRAKAEGRGRITAFDADQDRYVDRLDLGRRLRAAIDEGGLYLRYQPLFDVRTGAVCGAEALLRWRDGAGHETPPGVFVPYAESAGLMGVIGQLVLDQACWQAVLWDAGTTGPPVSVNLSAQQLAYEDFVDDVAATLDRYRLPPSALRMELTESVAAADPVGVARRLAALRRLGVTVSLDDFGTGHSSLAALRDLPVDELKVDRSFVARLRSGTRDETLVGLIVDTAHALGLHVVAEGVETVPQWQVLRGLGVDAVQGFLVGRPVAAADFRHDARVEIP